MKILFTLISLLLFLVSCTGKAPSKGKLSIGLTGMPLASAFGGLVIYGTSGTNRFTRVVANATGSLQGTIVEELPKGLWKFGAIGWIGPKAFAGEIRCAFSTVDLQTDESTVNLAMTNARCFDTDVALGGTFNGSVTRAFFGFATSFCEGDTSGRTNNKCFYNPMNTVAPSEKGFAGSYKIIVKDGSSLGGTLSDNGTQLESNCYEAGSDSEPGTAPNYTVYSDGINLPAFLPGIVSPIKVEAFLSHDCSIAKGSMILSLDTPAQAKVHWYSAGQNLLHLSTPVAALCGISDTMGTTTFASGVGSGNEPFLICTEKQLLHLQQSMNATAIKTSKYVLGRDINLLSNIQAGATSTPSDPCLSLGDTFTPIGKEFDAFPSCNLTDIAPSPLFGFDGNGKTISFFRFNSDTHQTGFISHLLGYVSHLTIDRAEVQGKDQTGIVVGLADSNTLKDVTVKNSRVEGNDLTGGILGHGMTSISGYELRVENTSIRGKSWVGGIAGKVDGGFINDSLFSGSINAEEGGNYVGGIVGRISGNINSAVSSGTIGASGNNVGGIAGMVNDLIYGRSDAYIFNTNFNSNVTGGIAGMAVSIHRSFFRGALRTNCTTGCMTGTISGMNPTTNTYNFAAVPSSDGGVAGSGTYDVNQMSTNPAFLTAICDLAGTCLWGKNAGDFPRISLESGGNCTATADNATVALQLGAGRGTETNPITVCSPSQFNSVTSPTGKYFSLKQNIPLSSFSQRTATLANHIDGEGNSLFGLSSIEANSNESLFNTVSAGYTIKNLQLAGFRIIDTGTCSNCHKALFAQINNGNLVDIEAIDSYIKVNDPSINVGTFVVENGLTGKISGAKIKTQLLGKNNVGGIASLNKGVIEDSILEARIDLEGSSANTVGGIVATNSSVVRRNRFKGEIKGLGTGSNIIGGIVGAQIKNANPAPTPTVIDNEVSSQAKLLMSTVLAHGGGIVGYSDNADNIIARNIFKGFLYDPGTVATINPVAGSGPFTSDINSITNGNFAVGTDFSNLDLTISNNLVTVYADSLCTLTVTADEDIAGVTFGALKIQNDKYLQGPMSKIGPAQYQLFIPMKHSDCTGLNGTLGSYLELYKAITTPDMPTVAILKANRFNIIDIGDAEENEIAFTAFKEILRGEVLSAPPVWLYDPDDEDVVSLFLKN
jgi:hypothetical protein